MAVMIRVARLVMKTPAQGAGTSIYLASSPEVEGITGRYFVNRKPKTSSKASYDTAAAARLWQVSADLTDMTATALVFGRRQMVMTIFPRACPCSRYWMALGASLSG
jgi:hypothetical protein